jgi:hypothetical protein
MNWNCWLAASLVSRFIRLWRLFVTADERAGEGAVQNLKADEIDESRLFESVVLIVNENVCHVFRRVQARPDKTRAQQQRAQTGAAATASLPAASVHALTVVDLDRVTNCRVVSCAYL